jgi:hypothetical protein
MSRYTARPRKNHSGQSTTSTHHPGQQASPPAHLIRAFCSHSNTVSEWNSYVEQRRHHKAQPRTALLTTRQYIKDTPNSSKDPTIYHHIYFTATRTYTTGRSKTEIQHPLPHGLPGIISHNTRQQYPTKPTPLPLCTKGPPPVGLHRPH